MIEICIDSYGFLVQAFEISRFRPHRTSSSSSTTLPRLIDAEPDHIRRVAAELPFEESHALWLVDVCGSNYTDAARQCCVDADIIRARVANGRQRLRAQLT